MYPYGLGVSEAVGMRLDQVNLKQASIWFERVKRNEGEQFGLQITNLGGKYGPDVVRVADRCGLP